MSTLYAMIGGETGAGRSASGRRSLGIAGILAAGRKNRPAVNGLRRIMQNFRWNRCFFVLLQEQRPVAAMKAQSGGDVDVAGIPRIRLWNDLRPAIAFFEPDMGAIFELDGRSVAGRRISLLGDNHRMRVAPGIIPAILPEIRELPVAQPEGLVVVEVPPGLQSVAIPLGKIDLAIGKLVDGVEIVGTGEGEGNIVIVATRCAIDMKDTAARFEQPGEIADRRRRIEDVVETTSVDDEIEAPVKGGIDWTAQIGEDVCALVLADVEASVLRARKK